MMPRASTVRTLCVGASVAAAHRADSERWHHATTSPIECVCVCGCARVRLRWDVGVSARRDGIYAHWWWADIECMAGRYITTVVWHAAAMAGLHIVIHRVCVLGRAI